MTSRERMLSVGVLFIMAAAVGGFLFQNLYLAPMNEREAAINVLQQELDKKQERVNQIETEKVKLERWKQISLPPDVDLARFHYEKYLSELLQESGFSNFSIQPRPADSKSSPTIGASKTPIYIKLPFSITAHSNLGNLVSFLEHFYRTGLLQQIKNLSIVRPMTPTQGQRGVQDTLDFTIAVEAVIVSGAEGRGQLLPTVDKRLLAIDGANALKGGPTGLALVPWVLGPTGPFGPGTLAEPPRKYYAIASKNIFIGNAWAGPTESDVKHTRYVELTDITQNDRYREASFYNRLTNGKSRLRSSLGVGGKQKPELGFTQFTLLGDKAETILRLDLVYMEGRELIFRMDESYYLMHVGDTLEGALRSRLSETKRKALMGDAGIKTVKKD